MSLVCRLIGHEDGPLTYIDEIEGGPNDRDLISVEVVDHDATRCSTCGRILYRPLDPDAGYTRSELVAAGVATLIGPELHDDDPTGRWGDRRIRRVGGWGERTDYLDPPNHNRADFEGRAGKIAGAE